MVEIKAVDIFLKEKVSTKKKRGASFKKRQLNKINYENDDPGMRGDSIVKDYISLYTDELF